jgi:hypothetical protein
MARLRDRTAPSPEMPDATPGATARKHDSVALFLKYISIDFPALDPHARVATMGGEEGGAAIGGSSLVLSASSWGRRTSRDMKGGRK